MLAATARVGPEKGRKQEKCLQMRGNLLAAAPSLAQGLEAEEAD